MASKVNGYAGKYDPGNGTEYSLGSTAYGYCETAADIAAKIVDMTGFTLMEGATVFIKFKYSNTAENPTLNIQSTGAKPIVIYDTIASGVNKVNGWVDNAVLCLTYDGTSWVRDYQPAITKGATQIVDQATAVFESAKANVPISELKVGIEPVQDLHGYDNPWPAGGGKNKIFLSADYASDNQNSTVAYHDGGVAVTATGGYGRYGWMVPVMAGTTYTISFKGGISQDTDVNRSIYLGDGAVVWASSAVGYIGRLYVFTRERLVTHTFTPTTNSLFIGCYVTNTATAAVMTLDEVQLELDSTATSYAPYSNLCPISGWSECKLWRTGKNLFNPSGVENGAFDQTTGEKIAGVQAQQRSTYYIKCNVGQKIIQKNESSLACRVFYFMGDKYVSTSALTNNSAITVPNGVDRFYFTSGTSAFSAYTNLQIEFSPTATPYEPYSGNQYTIQLGQTVYGGTLDVTTGTLAADRAELDMGDLNWTLSGRFFRTTSISDIVTGINKSAIICSAYKTRTGAGQPTEDFQISQNSSSGVSVNIVLVADSRYSDAATFKTAMSGVQLVYELATPITIPLTPTQIYALQGQNVLWADSGNIKLLRYYDDNAAVFHDEIYDYLDDYVSSASISDHAITLKNQRGTALSTVTVPDNNTTYTFASGTNGFTVTPSGGTAQTVTVTPSITNNITGTGTSGYLTKFNGTNTITNGPQLSSAISNQNQTTKFLREDGTWAAPSYTVDTNTDTKVVQTAMADSENVAYNILTTTAASPATGAREAKYGVNITYNPSTNKLSTGNLKLTGELDVTGDAYLHNQTSVDSLTAGSLLVNGGATFVQSPTAPTPAAASNDTTIATTAFVKGATVAAATALTSNAGSGTQPIYFSNGAPIATTYSLSSSVASGTATTLAYYSSANAISSGTATTDGQYLGNVSYLSLNTSHQTGYRLYVNGTSYFNGSITSATTTDSSNSTAASAFKTSGGASIAKNLSAKSIRIDNGQSVKGVSLQYDATLEVLNFIFS